MPGGIACGGWAGPGDVAVRADQQGRPLVGAPGDGDPFGAGWPRGLLARLDQHEAGLALELGQPPWRQRHFGGAGTDQRMLAAVVAQFGAGEAPGDRVPDRRQRQQPGREPIPQPPCGEGGGVLDPVFMPCPPMGEWT